MGRCFGRRQSSANSHSKRRPPSSFKAASSQGPNLVRNPFWLFLSQYRKNNKDADCHLSAIQVSVMAGKMWKGMTMEEKEPFLEAARKANYIFKLKNSPDGNLVLDKLRCSVAGGKFRAQDFLMLIEAIQHWRKSVLRSLNPKEYRKFN